MKKQPMITFIVKYVLYLRNYFCDRLITVLFLLIANSINLDAPPVKCDT